jgi:hypothetical protein
MVMPETRRHIAKMGCKYVGDMFQPLCARARPQQTFYEHGVGIYSSSMWHNSIYPWDFVILMILIGDCPFLYMFAFHVAASSGFAQPSRRAHGTNVSGATVAVFYFCGKWSKVPAHQRSTSMYQTDHGSG